MSGWIFVVCECGRQNMVSAAIEGRGVACDVCQLQALARLNGNAYLGGAFKCQRCGTKAVNNRICGDCWTDPDLQEYSKNYPPPSTWPILGSR